MSHTTKINKTVFIHNSDFSGNIEIQHNGQTIALPFSDIESIVYTCLAQREMDLMESTGESLYEGTEKITVLKP
jgi:hypothetical protein